ncbi:hypothetical protein PLICRDRAFT_46324 [Plicaturopsis crispa FD-325 SS-3]|uniref:Uncharacterized protein n=1 Tax=Plicaturopsis crispa FD-325 SS-3 TaxID=944288 RepID=A0A0C9SR67_PLICR|nr:hypothetical protein PLICRDRAFT_46324 [Plicaturopsis crispa FD-325 SS-3]
MIPRYSNPHLLNIPTKIVSRADLAHSNDDDQAQDDESSEVLGKRLRELIESELGETDMQQTTPRRGKRQKVQTDTDNIWDAQLMPFRLVSTSLAPQAVSLDPKPLPETKFREPDCEDNDAEAERRANRAKAVAVDFSWITSASKNSHSPHPHARNRLTCIKATLPDPPPVIFMAERRQSPRSTRPPVSVSALIPSDDAAGQNTRLPIISINDVPNTERRKRTRHRRQHKQPNGMLYKDKQTPQPVFWTPNVSDGGKSHGYAMGYPSWLAIGNDGLRQRTYTRDTMKKAVHIDDLWQNY